MKSFSEFLQQKIHNKGFKEGLQNPPTAGRQAPNAPTAGRQVPNADNSYDVFYHNLISPPGNMDPAKAIELAVRKFPKDEKEIRDNFAGMKSIEKYPDGHDNYGSYYQGLIDHGMTPEKAIELVVQKFPSDAQELRSKFAAMNARKNIKRV